MQLSIDGVFFGALAFIALDIKSGKKNKMENIRKVKKNPKTWKRGN